MDKAIAKEPGDRYQTMRELASDLRGLTRQRVTGAGAPPALQANRRIWTLTAAVVLLSVGGLVWMSSQRGGGKAAIERDLSDMLRLEAEVSQEIAREIRAHVTAQERTQLAGARMVNPGARDEYLQARHHSVRLNRTDLQQAVEHFERAISLEPVYAEAWAGLSIAHYEHHRGARDHLDGPNPRQRRDQLLRCAVGKVIHIRSPTGVNRSLHR